MSWFDQKKNEISESELIAYHLHELPPGRERTVARALEASSALTAKSAMIGATLQAVKDTPKPIDQAAFTRTWAALQPQLKPYAMPLAPKPHWQTPVFAKAALAGLAAMGVGVLAIRMYRPSFNVPAPAAPSAVESATAITSAPPDAESMPSLVSTGTFHERLSSRLPRSRAMQAEAAPIHFLTPYPTTSAPQTASSEQLPQKPEEPSVWLLTPPMQPATSAERTSQTAVATNIKRGTAKPLGPGFLPTPSRTDVMLALGGTFISAHTSLVAGTEQYTQTATHAITAVGALHQQFRSALGYRVTLSYTRPDFQYSYLTSMGGTYGGEINSRIFEAAGTYVVQGPHHGRWSTTADAGAALMAFLPTQNASASYAYRPAAVLGANVDYALGKHWAVRAAYRAQLFRAPNFRYSGGVIPVTTSLVVSQEPAVGIVYRFGKAEPPSRK